MFNFDIIVQRQLKMLENPDIFISLHLLSHHLGFFVVIFLKNVHTFYIMTIRINYSIKAPICSAEFDRIHHQFSPVRIAVSYFQYFYLVLAFTDL